MLRVKVHDIKRYHRAPNAARPMPVPRISDTQPQQKTRPGTTQLCSQPNASRGNNKRRRTPVEPVTTPQEKANKRPAGRCGASHAPAGRTPPDPPVVTDPNHSFEVDRVLHIQRCVINTSTWCVGRLHTKIPGLTVISTTALSSARCTAKYRLRLLGTGKPCRRMIALLPIRSCRRMTRKSPTRGQPRTACRTLLGSVDVQNATRVRVRTPNHQRAGRR